MAFWKRKKEEPTEKADEATASAEEEQASAEEPSAAEEPPVVAEQPAEEKETAAPEEKQGIFAKFRKRLASTHKSIIEKAESVFRRRGRIDDELLEDLEEVLITADVGVDATMRLMDNLRTRVENEGKKNTSDLEWLKTTMKDLVREVIGTEKPELQTSEGGPTIYLIVGVNGSGKTTAIGKLAHRYKEQGKQVILAAADTFRAAAIDQLKVWGDRSETDVISGREGGDPASVVFDALAAARARNADYLIIDTAGRLHTKRNLMDELAKIGRVIKREFPDAPHECLLVLDATTGQNGLSQAKIFLDAVNVTGIVLTKLDGTAKGGITIAVHADLEIPVKLVGLGEQMHDLDDFNPEAFVDAIFD
jgi:fused signal recognition particle receptor